MTWEMSREEGGWMTSEKKFFGGRQIFHSERGRKFPRGYASDMGRRRQLKPKRIRAFPPGNSLDRGL